MVLLSELYKTGTQLFKEAANENDAKKKEASLVKSVTYFRRSIDLDSRKSRTHCALARSMNSLNYPVDSCLESIDVSLKINPNSVAANHEKARILSRGGAYEEAMDIIKNLTERGACNAYTDAILKTIGKFRDLYDIVILSLTVISLWILVLSFIPIHRSSIRCYQQQ